MGLIDPKQATISGEVFFQGQDLLKLPKDEMRTIRGEKISMIWDPMTSLHPFYKVGYQIAEAILEHQDISKQEALDQAIEMLAREHPASEGPCRSVPARVLGRDASARDDRDGALAEPRRPDRRRADHRTRRDGAGADPRLIDRLKSEFNAAVVIITHDLGVVAEHCDNIMVMYAGKAAEFGDTDDIYYKPLHPYTWGLLSSIPRLDEEQQERLSPIRGLPPSLIQSRPGARSIRAVRTASNLRSRRPELLPVDGHHAAACHLSLADKERIRGRRSSLADECRGPARPAAGSLRRAAGEVEGIEKYFPRSRRASSSSITSATSMPSTAWTSRSTRARPSASSGRPGAASPPWRAS